MNPGAGGVGGQDQGVLRGENQTIEVLPRTMILTLYVQIFLHYIEITRVKLEQVDGTMTIIP